MHRPSGLPDLQVADTLERRSQVIDILTDAVKAYQAADVMETQGEVYLKNLGMLSDSLDDLKDRHEGAAGCFLHTVRSRVKRSNWLKWICCCVLLACEDAELSAATGRGTALEP